MSVRIDPARLRYERAIRGLSGHDLAVAAHLSDATVSQAEAGGPISIESLKLIAGVIDTTPVNEVIVRLLAPLITASSDEPSEPTGAQGAGP
jgi:transcriptional regulator with XRE-family HTH domain